MLEADSEKNSSFKLPIWGYLISAALVFAAYYITVKTRLTYRALIFTVIGIAFIQCIVQLVLFLNLGMESKPKWAIMTTFFALLVLIIVFGGSLWIMWNLNYNLMPTKL